jgi:hypothetical protein
MDYVALNFMVIICTVMLILTGCNKQLDYGHDTNTMVDGIKKTISEHKFAEETTLSYDVIPLEEYIEKHSIVEEATEETTEAPFIIKAAIGLLDIADNKYKKEEAILMENPDYKYDGNTADVEENKYYAWMQVEKIAECFNRRDAETLKNMFSKDTLQNFNIDEDIQLAFEQYEGDEILYHEGYGFGGAGGATRDENGNKIFYAWIEDLKNMKTNAGKTYLLEYSYVSIDADNPDSIGVNGIALSDYETNKIIAVIGDSFIYGGDRDWKEITNPNELREGYALASDIQK